MTTSDPLAIRTAVRERYAAAAVAAQGASCCATEAASCCGGGGTMPDSATFGAALYGIEQTGELPPAAVLASLGCGNPTALATLEAGQVVLDLGSGGGIDVFLSARRVGPTGKVYGLDMTPEMLELARRNQVEAGVENAEFLLGTIEDIPLPDQSVDVIISNCVINLSADKDKVLSEAFRVLRPGGLFAVSDVVLLRPLSSQLNSLMGLWTGCIAGALLDTEYEAKLASAGFHDIEVRPTLVHQRDDLVNLAAGLEVPDGVEVGGAIDEAAGAIANAFIRARR
jgi:SAM-dependent methyltransferase